MPPFPMENDFLHKSRLLYESSFPVHLEIQSDNWESVSHSLSKKSSGLAFCVKSFHTVYNMEWQGC